MAPHRKRLKLDENSSSLAVNDLTRDMSMLSSNQTTSPQEQQTPVVWENIRYNAPKSLVSNDLKTRVLSWVVPSHPHAGEECSICLSALDASKQEVKLPECGHVFHLECISDSVEHSKACPMCRQLIAEPQGKMPSGEMQVCPTSLKLCDEFGRNNIEIIYSIQSGVQKPYHQHPGLRFRGTKRTAYLPNNEDGRKLLKRLKYAFTRGLTFTVGTSLTTGAQNCVTWSSIHHKTSTNGGVHGFPDSSYFQNCNEDLDSLGVPSAQDLPASFTSTPNADSTGQLQTVDPIMDSLAGSISYAVPSGFVSSTITYGVMPPGTMDFSVLHDGQCRGLERDYIRIQYDIASGIQQAHHAFPGVPFRGAHRVAYLPYSEEGINLLKRLKCAFSRGLTFSVGTSLTTGKSNVVVWSTIPHKTNRSGGVFGYPDESYLARCNEALDSVRIPPAEQL